MTSIFAIQRILWPSLTQMVSQNKRKYSKTAVLKIKALYRGEKVFVDNLTTWNSNNFR